jgi:predicted alpha/beta hydrolase family esterase
MIERSMRYVFLAGIGDSELGHWQSIWFRSVGEAGYWVAHADWDRPRAEAWVRDLDDSLRALDGEKVLVAHSLGCLVVAEWARRHADRDIVGALLVALPDVAGPAFPRDALGFGGALAARLPFPATVVASADDPYCSLEVARRAAALLGARLVEVGAKGHINVASGVGDWPEGRALLDELVAR